MLTKYLGSGDNGIVYEADDGDIIKFTIDKNEALLWARLKNKKVPGIIILKDVINLSSSKTGDTHVFVIKAESAPHDVTQEQSKLIQNAYKETNHQTQQDLKKLRITGNKEAYINRRAINFVRAFQKIADIDQAFANIPGMIMDIADKHQAFIYDLRPDNFRLNKDGMVLLTDPSVPNLVGSHAEPEELTYEDKIDLTLGTIQLLFE